MRKITSIVLSLIMVFTMLSAVPAFANENSVTISATDATTIQFEDYVSDGNEGLVRENKLDSNIKFIGYYYSKVAYPVKDIPINVSKAGNYAVNVVMGRSSSSQSYGTTYITIYDENNEQLYQFNNVSATNYGDNLTGYGSSTSTSHYLTSVNLYNLGVLSLPAGNLKISVKVKSNAGTYGTTNSHCVLDYITFEGIGNGGTVSVSDTGATTVEFKDYVLPAYAKYVRKNSNKTENMFVGYYYQNVAYPISDISLDVAKGGTYDVNLIMAHHVNSGSYGVVTVEIVDENNKVLSTFDNYEGKNYSGELEGYYWNNEYEPQVANYSTKVNLPKGKVTIAVKVKSNQGNFGTYSSNCILDNIKFTPVALDNMAEADGTVTLTGNYTKEISGTPIIALYNGDKLVAAQECDAVNNATVVTATIDSQGKAYTEAKLFVWNNMNDIVPQVASKTYIK